MLTTIIEPQLTDDETAALKGYHLDDSAYDRLIGLDESIEGYRPDGTRLLVVVRGALPSSDCLRAAKALENLKAAPANRFTASGRDPKGRTLRINKIVERNGKRYRTRTDMIPSYVSRNLRIGDSAIIGYFDPAARYPFCRCARWNTDFPGRWADVLPLVRAVDRTFAQHVPERYAEQKLWAERTKPEWVIPGTVFTTITVNRNYRCATHTDIGDLKTGFSTLAVIRRGQYDGGHLILPKYKLAIALTTGDLLLFDPHEYHTTSPFHGLKKRFERLSLVFYYRTKMEKCGSPEEELERAKTVAGKMDMAALER